jgi:hypothetical protein
MGSAEKVLGHKLPSIYLTMLRENDFVPGAICFYAEGVKLAVEGSPVLDLLRQMEAQGTHLVICSTCLQHLGLTDQVAAGGGMDHIVLAQWLAN